MSSRSQPEILPPEKPGSGSRFPRADAWVADENLDLLARVLDEWFRVPGTTIRFGLDGIIGLLPGLGDVLGGLASCLLILAAWVRGVPYVTLMRMVVNVGVEVVLGTIPLFGDLFDIAWKANRRNYALITRHLQQNRQQTWRDWIFLCLIATALCLLFLIPLLLMVWLLQWVSHRP